MYATHSARLRSAHVAVILTVAGALALVDASRVFAQMASPSLMQKLSGQTDKLELTTNTSRILTLDKNIPRVQVNNPDLIAVTPLSANQVQISAKKAGVTQVNLWDEDGNIHTVDVLIYGDVQELQVALQTQFPNSTIKVFRYSESLVLKGFVDQPEHVSQIVQLASDYAPKVINNITVGGVQQVLLKVRVMEVSRTKLRQLGVDWAYDGNNGSFVLNSISDILRFNDAGDFITNNNDTFAFGIVHGETQFLGFLEAMQRNSIAKILAEPNIVAVSGRPAQFNVGGEFPIIVPQSLGTSSIEFKKYGTQIDFLPIVLGNGNIRLEVRPRVSSLDPSTSVILSGVNVPGLKVREVDTAVEMKAGQTFALAGLVQELTESRKVGLPYISDIPFFGVPFRKEHNDINEIELLIMVTPEFVDAIGPDEVQCAGPGYFSTNPDNCDLYCGGHVEVPAKCNPISGMTACGECGGPCAVSAMAACGGCGGCGCASCGGGPAGGAVYDGPATGPVGAIVTEGMPMPGGTGYDDTYEPTPMEMNSQPPGQDMSPDLMTLPPSGSEELLPSQSSSRPLPPTRDRQAILPVGGREYTVPRPYSPERQPVFVRNATSPQNPQPTGAPVAGPGPEGGLFGPVGYDAE